MVKRPRILIGKIVHDNMESTLTFECGFFKVRQYDFNLSKMVRFFHFRSYMQALNFFHSL